VNTAVTPQDIRTALLLRQEIALLDLRHEAVFATAHPLFAANMAADRIALEAPHRLPRKVRGASWKSGCGQGWPPHSSISKLPRRVKSAPPRLPRTGRRAA